MRQSLSLLPTKIAPTCWLKSGCASVVWFIPTFPVQTCIPILTHRCIPLCGPQLWHRFLPALIISPLSSHLRSLKSDMLEKSHDISQQHFFKINVYAFTEWFIIAHFSPVIFKLKLTKGKLFRLWRLSRPISHAASLRCWFVTCLVRPVSPFSLVISKHSSMFKIGQFRSVDPGPSEVQDPWGLVLLWSGPFVTWGLTWLQLEEKKGFVVLDLKMVPGFPHFPWWHPKCQPHHLEQIHQEKKKLQSEVTSKAVS